MAGFRNLFCDDEERRARVLAHPVLNGIDAIEVPTETLDAQRFLRVFFLKVPPPAGLVGRPQLFQVRGGFRVRNIQVRAVTLEEDHLVVEVDRAGDFSTYTLAIQSAELDPAYARREFSFKAGCPTHFDCQPEPVCPPEPLPEPLIDYLAKDYASFRQTLIDRIPSLAPQWTDRHEADLGIALVELLAYAGDQLSYYQDAIANELSLETARQRVSVRRHARLIDYHVHDGASARAFIHFRVQGAGVVPAGTTLLSQLDVRLGASAPPHGPVIPAALREPALAAAGAVFETMAAARVDPRLNEIAIHAWGNRRCCLPRGVTGLDLVGDLVFDPAVDPTTPDRLRPGDFLLLEEVRGPDTGRPADADPTHRQVVRLTGVVRARDPLLELDLTRVSWDGADRLTFPLCLSARLPDGTLVDGVSVARGNLALADHGRTVAPDELHSGPERPADEILRRAYRLRLREGPLSFRIPLREAGPPQPVSELLATDPRQAEPQVTRLTVAGSLPPDDWRPFPDLLASSPFDHHVAVETENDGRALLRFGDDEFGKAPPDGAAIEVRYRIGVGAGGNVGRESLLHVIAPDPLPLDWPDLAAPSTTEPKPVRNPLPAWGGIDPEPPAQVKRLAPAAFHAEQFRAVTEADYARAAEKHPRVAKAVATFRWTGSWHTVFLTIDPLGQTELPPELQASVRAWVIRFTQAGYDLEIDPPVFVPLDLTIAVCVKPRHFAADVEEALLAALSNQVLPDGTPGFFHPDHFTFGGPLYLSRLYAAVEAVEGVDSAVVTRFQRFGKAAKRELEEGVIRMDRLEVLRLDNDPDFPEHGVLALEVRGGP